MIEQDNSENNLIDLIEISFEDVNNRVHDLLECSVKDFVVLNDNFQKQYKLLETLSLSTNAFLNTLSDIPEIKHVKETHAKSQGDLLKIEQNFNENSSKLKTLYEKYHFASLRITNLKQDLSTLRLLFTNLKFEPGLSFKQDQVQACYSDFDLCLSQYTEAFNKSIQLLSSLTNLTENRLNNSFDIININAENIINLTQSLNTIQDGAQKQTSVLANITKEKNSNTSDIITNLQFQDILRQKIEHIQSAHELITKKLFENHTNKNELTPKQLSQIRDISSLQSAQLVHANNEYQNAVETILKRFNSLTTIAHKFNSIWNHHCKPEIQSIINKQEKSVGYLTELNNQTDELDEIKKLYDELEFKLAKQFSIISDEKFTEKCGCSFISNFDTYFESINQNLSKNKSFSATDQFKHELEKFKKGHSKFIQIIEDLNSFHTKYRSTLSDNISQASEISKLLSKEILSLINRLSAFKEIPSPSESVLNITLGIDKVSYYITFEKEVREIIESHNSILKKINVEKIDPDEDNLEELRKMYTMQSERNIHNSHTHQSDSNSSDENDENEVEFF